MANLEVAADELVRKLKTVDDEVEEARQGFTRLKGTDRRPGRRDRPGLDRAGARGVGAGREGGGGAGHARRRGPGDHAQAVAELEPAGQGAQQAAEGGLEAAEQGTNAFGDAVNERAPQVGLRRRSRRADLRGAQPGGAGDLVPAGGGPAAGARLPDGRRGLRLRHDEDRDRGALRRDAHHSPRSARPRCRRPTTTGPASWTRCCRRSRTTASPRRRSRPSRWWSGPCRRPRPATSRSWSACWRWSAWCRRRWPRCATRASARSKTDVGDEGAQRALDEALTETEVVARRHDRRAGRGQAGVVQLFLRAAVKSENHERP